MSSVSGQNTSCRKRSVCPRSRLASCITLTKEMDGITVLVPETNQDLTNCALHHPHPHPTPHPM